MLAYYVEWHMREAWRELMFADEDLERIKHRDPIAAANRSEAALDIVATCKLKDGSPVHSFRTLLEELSTIVRNTCQTRNDYLCPVLQAPQMFQGLSSKWNRANNSDLVAPTFCRHTETSGTEVLNRDCKLKCGLKPSFQKEAKVSRASMWLTTCVALMLVTACSAPNLLVYSSGFSFGNYDYVVISKPDGRDTSTSLYGMDVEFSNLMSRFNMKVIGDKEYEQLPLNAKKRTLNARMAISASNNRILLSVSFDDAVSGRTGASISSFTKGKLFKTDAREKAFEVASETIIKALERDKGLEISQDTVASK